MGSDFDANYSGPPTTVFSGTVDLPATGPGGVNDWKACVTFSTVFNYGGGNLIVEIMNNSPTYVSNWVADFCVLVSGCNTTRVYAYSTISPSGLVAVGMGLAMRLSDATPDQVLATLQSQVDALAGAGSLNGGQATSLGQQLAQVLKKVNQGQPGVAAAVLAAFVNHVSDLVADGVLTLAEGQPLIDLANSLIDTLNG